MAKQKRKSNRLIYWSIAGVIVLILFFGDRQVGGLDWEVERNRS